MYLNHQNNYKIIMIPSRNHTKRKSETQKTAHKRKTKNKP